MIIRGDRRSNTSCWKDQDCARGLVYHRNCEYGLLWSHHRKSNLTYPYGNSIHPLLSQSLSNTQEDLPQVILLTLPSGLHLFTRLKFGHDWVDTEGFFRPEPEVRTHSTNEYSAVGCWQVAQELLLHVGAGVTPWSQRNLNTGRLCLAWLAVNRKSCTLTVPGAGYSPDASEQERERAWKIHEL